MMDPDAVFSPAEAPVVAEAPSAVVDPYADACAQIARAAAAMEKALQGDLVRGDLLTTLNADVRVALLDIAHDVWRALRYAAGPRRQKIAMALDDLPWSIRTGKELRKRRIATVLDLLSYSAADLKAAGFGATTVMEIVQRLADAGLTLRKPGPVLYTADDVEG